MATEGNHTSQAALIATEGNHTYHTNMRVSVEAARGETVLFENRHILADI